METNELMIGDWVYNKHHGKNIRLNQYDFFTHTHNDFGEQELAPFAKPTTGHDLEPIQLTPEILEKNGFVHKTRWMQKGNFGYPPLILWHLLSSKILNRPEHLLEIHCGMKNIHISFLCEYVHQLQHALRLAGSDMEITL